MKVCYPKRNATLDEVYDLTRMVLFKLETLEKEVRAIEIGNKIIMDRLGVTTEEVMNECKKIEA